MMIGCRQLGTNRGTLEMTIGFAEYGAAQNVADGAVGRAPHPLQPELLDARLVGRDGRAFDTDPVATDRLRRLDRDTIVAGITGLDAQVVVEKLDVQIGQDQPLLDPDP